MRVEAVQTMYEALQRHDWPEVIALAEAALEEEKNGGKLDITPEERVLNFELASKEFG